MNDYGFKFDVVKRGWRWVVVANPGNYRASVPFWTEIAALREQTYLTQWYRSGFDEAARRACTHKN